VQRREEDVLREEHARREALTTDTLLRKIEPLSESLSRRKSKIDENRSIQNTAEKLSILDNLIVSNFSNEFFNFFSIANVDGH